MKIKKLLDAVPALRKIAAQDLSLKTLYTLSKTIGKIENELGLYEVQRQKLISQYCDRHESGFTVKNEFKDEFSLKFSELLDFEVDMENVKPVKIPYDEKITLSYNDLVALGDFIVLESEDDGDA